MTCQILRQPDLLSPDCKSGPNSLFSGDAGLITVQVRMEPFVSGITARPGFSLCEKKWQYNYAGKRLAQKHLRKLHAEIFVLAPSLCFTCTLFWIFRREKDKNESAQWWIFISSALTHTLRWSSFPLGYSICSRCIKQGIIIGGDVAKSWGQAAAFGICDCAHVWWQKFIHLSFSCCAKLAWN